MKSLFNKLGLCINKNKGLFIFLIICALVLIVLGVVAAVGFSSTIDLGNIPYIRFLRGGAGIFSLIFNTIISSIIVYVVMLVCGIKKFLLPISFVFYLYLIYTMGVVFTSLILIYGFFATIILLILLFAYFVCQIVLFTAILCEIICAECRNNYFKNCFNKNGCLRAASLMLVALIVLFCVLLILIKQYVILLVY